MIINVFVQKCSLFSPYINVHIDVPQRALFVVILTYLMTHTHTHTQTCHNSQQHSVVDEMDEESPLIINHNKRGVPSSDVQSNDDSEFSSPPPDDGSSGGEQVYTDERMPHPAYMMSPANMIPMVEHGGFISPGAHPPPVLLMATVQSEGFSTDRELNESPLQGAELRKQLVTQLEYYFSKENLSSDKYLCKSQN